MYYYAELNENNICIGVFESLTALTDSNYIAVDSLDANLVGMMYDRESGTWETPPFSVIAAHSTDEINYKATNQTLSDVLDGKASASHTHANYALTNHTHTGFASENHTHDEYAPVEHSHSGYASANHTHSGYAPTSHEHSISEVTGLNSALSGKADSNHTHDYAASTHNHTIAQVTGLQTALDGKAASSHTHDYAPTNHTHNGFASSEHTHTIANVSGLNDALNGKAPTSHTHNYAPSSHTHDYLSTAGGTLSGAVIFTGNNALKRSVNTGALSIFGGTGTNNDGAHLDLCGEGHSTLSGYFLLHARTADSNKILTGAPNGTLTWDGGVFKIGGQQSIYVTDARMTFGTTNRETYITGSTIYSRSTIQVASDARLKTDIEDADAERAIEFIRNLKIHDYRYKDSDEKRIGVIAQELLADEYGKRFVKEDKDGMLSVNYSELIFPLIMAVQKLMNKE